MARRVAGPLLCLGMARVSRPLHKDGIYENEARTLTATRPILECTTTRSSGPAAPHHTTASSTYPLTTMATDKEQQLPPPALPWAHKDDEEEAEQHGDDSAAESGSDGSEDGEGSESEEEEAPLEALTAEEAGLKIGDRVEASSGVGCRRGDGHGWARQALLWQGLPCTRLRASWVQRVVWSCTAPALVQESDPTWVGPSPAAAAAGVPHRLRRSAGPSRAARWWVGRGVRSREGGSAALQAAGWAGPHWVRCTRVARALWHRRRLATAASCVGAAQRCPAARKKGVQSV